MEVRAMLPYANNLVEAIHLDDPLPVCCLSQERINDLATPTQLDSFKSYLLETEDDYLERTHSTIVWLEASLRNPHGLEENDKVEQAAAQIQQWVIAALTPPVIYAPESPFDTGPRVDAPPFKFVKWRLLALAGLRLLSHLQQLVPNLYRESSLDLDLVSCLAAFTDARDPWTRPEALETATTLLDGYLSLKANEDQVASQLLTNLLQNRVRRWFAKSRSNAITEQGRKAAFPLTSAADSGEVEAEVKPWKFRKIIIVTVFRWILLRMIESTAEANWPLVIPPLLTILDDEATNSKVKGCELLDIFLKVTPTPLLQRTGLGEVFQDSLMPCLSYLPTLTPEEESVRLLSAVYPALLTLIRRRYAESGEDGERLRIKALDKILRVGILQGYAHAGGNVTIATLLVSQISELVNEMGISSVKHLKDLIPLLSNILSAPFGLAYPPLLKASAMTLQAIILNGWPRMSYYRGDILKGITACWCDIQEDGRVSEQFEDIRVVLKQDVELLKAALDADMASIQEIDDFLDSDARLSGLGM